MHSKGIEKVCCKETCRLRLWHFLHLVGHDTCKMFVNTALGVVIPRNIDWNIHTGKRRSWIKKFAKLNPGHWIFPSHRYGSRGFDKLDPGVRVWNGWFPRFSGQQQQAIGEMLAGHSEAFANGSEEGR